MGELILMLLLTCVVCGGIPALVFAYINGKIKFSNHGETPSEKQKRLHPKLCGNLQQGVE